MCQHTVSDVHSLSFFSPFVGNYCSCIVLHISIRAVAVSHFILLILLVLLTLSWSNNCKMTNSCCQLHQACGLLQRRCCSSGGSCWSDSILCCILCQCLDARTSATLVVLAVVKVAIAITVNVVADFAAIATIWCCYLIFLLLLLPHYLAVVNAFVAIIVDVVADFAAIFW